MNNSAGVAIVESIAKLIEEQFHVIACHRLLMLTHVFF